MIPQKIKEEAKCIHIVAGFWQHVIEGNNSLFESTPGYSKSLQVLEEAKQKPTKNTVTCKPRGLRDVGSITTYLKSQQVLKDAWQKPSEPIRTVVTCKPGLQLWSACTKEVRRTK